MWAVVVISGISILLTIALLAAYFNISNTVKIMKNTLDWHNKRYNACLEGWERANKSVEKVISLNDQVIELNKQLISKI